MLRKPRILLGLFIVISLVLTLIVAFHTVPSTLANYPYEISEPMDDITSADTEFTPPFQTAGRHIVDADGKRLKLASVNWYGASDIFFVPMGLDIRHRSEIAKTIKNMGFNSVRFPYSDQMVLENPIVDPKHLQANLDLLDSQHMESKATDQARLEEDSRSIRALDVFNACVTAMTDEGIVVIPNNHITNAAWCDGKNLCDSSWKNSQYGPICKIYQTTESWIENWKTVMEPFIDNPLVIGADLRNEPRGLWGTMTWSMWATAAEQASEALLAMQPDWLMFVEGVSSANDCSGARTRPVKLSIPDRVVYSSHVYSWSGWGALVPYHKRPYPSFALDMEKNWGYLLRSNTAPVWVGEFGAPSNAGEGDLHYWNNLMKYLRDVDADFGYWALSKYSA
jgi:endoglucanase